MTDPLDELRARTRALVPIVGVNYVTHTPTPKQAAFLKLDCLEALYGGAAGGGKSDALLMAALEYVHVPGYAALLLRRTYADLALPGAIMSRAKDWLIPKGVPWNDKEKRFTFPSGASLNFGYLDTDADRYRYQGAELQFIGFDELTQFAEKAYRYLLSRLRRLQGVEVPLRARGASNPGGLGHDWVRRRFVETLGDTSRAFVPASLVDNPFLDQVEYAKALEQLDATTRRQLLEGIWVRDSGGLVYAFDDAENVIATAPRCDQHILGIDYGFTDDTAFAVIGWRKDDPHAYILEAYSKPGLTPSAAAEEAFALERSYKFAQIVGDTGGLGKGYVEEARTRFGLPIEAAEKQNKRGYISLMNGDLARRRVKVVKATCEQLLAEWAELPWVEDRQKEAEGFANHCSDATLYAWRACCAFTEREQEEKPAPGSKEAEAARAKAEEEKMLRELAEEERDAKGWARRMARR